MRPFRRPPLPDGCSEELATPALRSNPQDGESVLVPERPTVLPEELLDDRELPIQAPHLLWGIGECELVFDDRECNGLSTSHWDNAGLGLCFRFAHGGFLARHSSCTEP